jgi:cytochrome P450
MNERSNASETSVDLVRDPHAPTALNELARASAVANDVSGLLWVLRYTDVERLAIDRRLHGVRLTIFDLMGITEGPLRRWYGSLMFTNEGDAHGRLRRLVNAAFKPKAVSALRAATRAIVEERFGDLRRDGGGDLMREFQYVPMRVMCDLLGVPHEDVSIFGAWADALSPVFLFMSPEQIDAATDALGELLGYLDKLVDRRRRRPDEDLISALIAAEDEGNRLTHEELLDMVANLLVGGHDTTASQIGCTLFELLVRPETVAELAARPQTIASAVDETLRLQPAIFLLPRTVIEPIEIAGAIRLPGTLLGLATGAANRDPVVWERPDDFVLDRFEQPDAPRLLTFGTGSHYCLGANLAHMTLEETVRGLVENPSDPSVDLTDIAWRMVLGRSPVSLPIELR